MTPAPNPTEARGRAAFDPTVLDALSKLSLVARTLVEGFMAGSHRARVKGSSMEFAQHREYVPGDDPRFIDERIFAKSDRLVVKEFVAETNFACHLLLDASGSMGFGSAGKGSGSSPRAEGTRSKLDYARWCAAALGYLVLGQRDTAGLVVFDSTDRKKVPPGNGAAQGASIVELLEQTQATGETAVGDVLNWLLPRLRQRGIVCVFSDFFDDPEPLMDGVRKLRIAGHEPILFQVLDPAELEFEYAGHLRLDDLEGGAPQKVDAKAIAIAYREEILKHNAALAAQASSFGVDLVQLRTDQPLDVALQAYLAKRTARARSAAK